MDSAFSPGYKKLFSYFPSLVGVCISNAVFPTCAYFGPSWVENIYMPGAATDIEQNSDLHLLASRLFFILTCQWTWFLWWTLNTKCILTWSWVRHILALSLNFYWKPLFFIQLLSFFFLFFSFSLFAIPAHFDLTLKNGSNHFRGSISVDIYSFGESRI